VRVKSINCTGFLEKKTKLFTWTVRVNNSLALVFFFKKKTIHVNSAIVEHDSTIHWTVELCSTVVVPPPREAANAASPKLAAPSLFLVGPTTIMHFFLLNQTILCVAAGEPHPQPSYQTGTKFWPGWPSQSSHTLRLEFTSSIVMLLFIKN